MTKRTPWQWALKYNPGQPRAPEGQSGGGQWISSSGGSSGTMEPWATRISTWTEGHSIPAEMYDGLESASGGKIKVRKYKDGTYTVSHNMGGAVDLPYVTRGDHVIAQNSAERLYGRILNNEIGDLIGQHRKIVERAIRQGQPVPDEIFIDYPDLRPKK